MRFLPYATEPLWFSGFVLLLAFLPLPFGGNRPWASDLVGVWTGALLLMLWWQQRKTPEVWEGKPPFRVVWVGGALALVPVVWGLVQIAPWTPASLHHPLWSLTADLTQNEGGAISVAPDKGPESLIRLASYLGCFVLAFFAALRADRAKKLLWALSVIGCGYAAYGLAAQFLAPAYILWFKKWAYQGFLTATFVNKNSYATYAGMGFLCGIGWLWSYWKHLSFADKRLAQKSKLAAWLQQAGREDLKVILMPLVVLGALVLSGSRAGLASATIGVLVFGLALAVNQRWKWPVWVALLGGILVLLASALSLGGDMFFERMGNKQIVSDTGVRFSAYLLIKDAILNNPWFGLGIGSFDNAFALYRSDSLALWFQHAHNDYLEMALELGLPAALALLAALGLGAAACLAGVWKRKRREVYAVVAVAASALVAAHGLMDFSLQMPAIAATYASILGMGVAQSRSTR